MPSLPPLPSQRCPATPSSYCMHHKKVHALQFRIMVASALYVLHWKSGGGKGLTVGDAWSRRPRSPSGAAGLHETSLAVPFSLSWDSLSWRSREAEMLSSAGAPLNWSVWPCGGGTLWFEWI
jgi:hypothetical protein